MKKRDLERRACTPQALNPKAFNPKADLPYCCTVEHISKAMNDFIDFLGFVNLQLYSKRIQRLESFLMPANFSSMVGEFIIAAIPKYCSALLKNRYHNGHPDLIPCGVFENDRCLHGAEGVEVKASRHTIGWQGHNPEDVWLMVFVFDSSSARDQAEGIDPRPFKFVKVVGARLAKADWAFSGRSATSRRTITASVKRTGYEKMEANWIYRDPPTD